MALDGLQKARCGILVQRFDVLLDDSRQRTGIGRVRADVANHDRLAQRLVQHTMNVLDGLGRKSWLAVSLLAKIVVKLLDGMSIKHIQLDGSHRGVDVVLDMLGVVEDGVRFHTAQVLF